MTFRKTVADGKHGQNIVQGMTIQWKTRTKHCTGHDYPTENTDKHCTGLDYPMKNTNKTLYRA